MTFLILCFFQWLAGFVVWGRLRPCGENKLGSPGLIKNTSVIIPARNEENKLPRLLRSILEQNNQPKEIIVTDDASTDATADVARKYGARVVSSLPLPEGWRGKTWACHQGAAAATGDYFLFLDADTWFEPEGLAKAAAFFPSGERGALSVAPYHQVQRWHEQYSAFFNLIMLGGTGAFSILRRINTRPGLLGQFLLIDRNSYFAAGGHEVVRGKVLENFWLSQQLHKLGVPTRCVAGRGSFSFRMYENGWSDLVEGWTKGFASGAGQTPVGLLILIILWLGGIVFVPVGIYQLKLPSLWCGLYLACAIQIAWLLRQVGSFRLIVPLAYPMFVLFFFGLFTRSLIRGGKKVNWKGREINAG